MAKRKRKSAESSIVNELNNVFSSFKFPHSKIYSHENNTILIHHANIDQMDDIVNVEISSESAKERGFIVLRFHDDLRHVISDESMYQFLVHSGDHQQAKQYMKADMITFENVYSNRKPKKPTGIFCHSILLQSVVSGKSVKELKQKAKPTSEVSAENSVADEAETTNECVISLATDNMELDVSSTTRFHKGQFLSQVGTDLSNECPCGKHTTEHTISCAELDYHTSQPRPLLHEAYVGQLRITKYRSLLKNRFPDPSRLNDAELMDCEAILCRMLQKPMNFEYMLYAGTVKIESSYTNCITTSLKYDMFKEKNDLEECMKGDAADGITSPWTYFGFAGSVFATHVEDIAYLNSVNLMLYGSPKVWIFVSADQAITLQMATAKYLQTNAAKGKSEFLNCTLQHKMTFVHPALLDLWGIKYTVVVQKPGEIIYTCAAAFHTGFNLGVNVNLAKNTLHFDFKMMMLPELHTPVNDVMRCRPNCPQSMDTFLESRVTGSFLLSFYKMLFKSNHSDCDMANMRTFLERFYSGTEIVTPVSLKDEQVRNYVDKQLKNKLDEIYQMRCEMEARIANKIIRLKCAVIREVTATVALPIIQYEMDTSFSDNTRIIPSRGSKLSQVEENKILTQAPFLHITVSHLEYGGMSEMQLSINEKILEEYDEDDELHKRSKSKQVSRNVTNYHELNKYWTTIVENVDYIIIKTLTNRLTERHNQGMIGKVEALKVLSKTSKQLHKKKKRLKMRSVEIVQSSDIEDQEIQHNDEQPCFQVLHEDSELKLIQIEDVYYFICLICFDFKTMIVDITESFQNQQCNKQTISDKLISILKTSKGSFSTPRSLKEHLEKFVTTYKCLLCEKINDETKTFKTKHDLAAHIRCEHQKHQIFCPICSQSFSQPRYLRSHWFNHGKSCIKLRVLGKQKNVKTDGFHCSTCDKLAHKQEDWMIHLNESLKCHKNSSADIEDNSDESSDSDT